MNKEELIREYNYAKFLALENLVLLMIKTIEETEDPVMKRNLEGFFTYVVLANDNFALKVIELEKKIAELNKGGVQ